MNEKDQLFLGGGLILAPLAFMVASNVAWPNGAVNWLLTAVGGASFLVGTYLVKTAGIETEQTTLPTEIS